MFRRIAFLLLFVPSTVRAQVPTTYPPPAEVRAALHKLLDRPLVPPDVRTGETKPLADGLTAERFTFASERKPDGTTERVPVLLVKPANVTGRLPAVIVLHGTGGTKDRMQDWLTDLAKRGIIGVAIDARYHGDRAGGAKGKEA